MRTSWLGVLCLSVIALAPAGAQTLTYVDLVNRLVDMESLSILPAGETCAQASSYDRTSKFDVATGKYVGWDANGDGGGYIRREGESFVIAELKGPGCIWRTWSALAQAGHVRIYLDGSSEPAVDLPFSGYFDLKNEPFIYPSLVHDASQGKNCYVPIPYQKSCRIIADKGWGAYYQFTYTTFPKGTTVPTFTRDLSAEETAALERVDRILTSGLGSAPVTRADSKEIVTQVSVKPGRKAVVAQIEGPNAITELRAKISEKQLTDEELRSVLLRIYWDGEKKPSVWSPIGDFFGTGPGLKQYKSLPLGVTSDDAYSFWYMPFAKSAVVEIANEGRKTFSTEFKLTVSPLTQPVERLGRFHAKWHRDVFMPAEKERWIDWPILLTQGAGRFVGVALEVWNPRGGWWGEGDEKWFVDGEKFPSTFGTGSEDYFGYAWCDPTPFQNAFHNQTRNDNVDNTNHISVNRWQIADNIPFTTSFDGYIEKYWNNERPTRYAGTAYWYLSPNGIDSYEPVKVKDRLSWYNPPTPPKLPEGFYEGELMTIKARSAGLVEPQSLQEHWSRDAHLWWTGAKPGDTLDLEMPVKKGGRYELLMAFTCAVDYGVVQMKLDGVNIGEPIDFYNRGIIRKGPLSFGVFDLKAGKHTLTAQIIGANPVALKGYMFGLDCVELKKANAQ